MTVTLTEHISGIRGQAMATLGGNSTAVLGESETRRLLESVVPFGEAVECRTDEEVRAATESLGFPVVIKGLSPRFVHKSEHGLVRVNCRDTGGVLLAAAELRQAVGNNGDAKDFVLSVQRQLSGLEVAIGIRRDRVGSVLMVAAGGTLVEILKDVATDLAPVDRAQAAAMVSRLRIAPLLSGYRASEALDTEALISLIVTVAEIAAGVPELEELDLNPVFVGVHGCGVADARAVLSSPTVEEEAPVDATAVASILRPSRIAIIGASEDESKVGGLVLRYLRRYGWNGEIIAVNTKPLSVDGIKTYPKISDVPGRVDLAALAVPAAAVPDVVGECAAAGVPAGVILSAGFAEAGEGGRALQERVVERAREGGFRFVGPNTIGVASPREKMYATFGMALEAAWSPGSAGFISQSGAIASSLISRASEFGVGFSHWISVGNEADLGVADFIEYLAKDDATSVICLFLEAIRRPGAFAAACQVARDHGKPIVAIKTGRSEAGRAAAVSHTGALTGSDIAYEAFFRRHGVFRAADLPGMLAAVQGLTSVGPVRGPRVAVVSMSGGACSLIADACSDLGLEVPALSSETQDRLRQILPSFGGVQNPIDVTASGIRSPDLVGKTIEVLRKANETDAILLQLSTNADPAASVMAADLIELSKAPGIPFLLGRLGSPALAPQAVELYKDAGLHVFSWPGEMVAAIAASVHFGRNCQIAKESA